VWQQRLLLLSLFWLLLLLIAWNKSLNTLINAAIKSLADDKSGASSLCVRRALSISTNIQWHGKHMKMFAMIAHRLL